VTYSSKVSTFDSRDRNPAAYEALLRRDLVRERGIPPAFNREHDAQLTERQEPRVFGPLLPSPGCDTSGRGQQETNVRLHRFGKPAGPKFTAAGYAPFDDLEKMQPPKWLTKWSKKKKSKKSEKRRAKFHAWAFEDRRWWGRIGLDKGRIAADLDEWLTALGPTPETADGDDTEPVCRECWREGITTYAVADPVRPWQREWRLCEDHSRAERRDRRHPRSTTPCAACGYIQWRHHDGTVYLEEVRPGCVIHEACWKAWTRERKQGTSWPVFAKARRIRVRARRILEEVLECQEEYDRIAKKERRRAGASAAGDLMSLRHADPVGEISPAWRHYLERAIGRKHTNVVKLVLESRNGTVVPFGRPIAVPAPSHNGSARAASFVISSSSTSEQSKVRAICH
jgi:hypothetical protein